MDSRSITVALATCPELEPSMMRRILRVRADLERLWFRPQEVLVDCVRNPALVAARIDRWRRAVGSIPVEQRLRSKGILSLLPEDAGYPRPLLDLPDPPTVLFALGQPDINLARSVAVVGTRRASSYGLEAASWIAESVGGAGCAVVSGLAIGIDGAAHRSALNAGGHTVAVMACGPDVCYPVSHETLWMNIQKKGVIYSEYAPGSPVAKHRFPERNRLIAALARAVVVVQAGEKSGALRTVDSALELGRDVYAVPGPITSIHFRGAHKLIQDGARILVDPVDLLRDLGISDQPHGRSRPTRYEDLYDAIADAITASELSDMLGQPVSHVYTGLLELELSGFIERVPGGTYRRLI